jgi:hypothetical protein
MQANLHALGLSQKQMDGVVGELLSQGLKIRSEAPVMAEAECVATLRQLDGWKEPEQYSKQMTAARSAVKSFMGDQYDTVLERYGNDPLICQLLAKVGAELPEDRQASPEAQAQVQESLDRLQSHPAFLNPHHAEHANIVAQVNALTAKQVGTRPVGTGRTMSFKT